MKQFQYCFCGQKFLCKVFLIVSKWRGKLCYQRLCLFGKITFLSSSGGYSNLGARGKNFQKFMLSEKKKRSDLGLDIFLPKSKCSLKKKKKGLHFNFISDSPLFLPKSRYPPKKKKKVFTPNRPLSESKTVYAVFEGGPPKKGGA